MLSRIEQLPVELLSCITCLLPLSTLLSFLTVSRSLWSNLIGSISDRDALARAWIHVSAPWYEVIVPEDYLFEECIKPDDVLMGWAYLRWCLDSGPMRNRKRIWGIAEQLERKADQMGIWYLLISITFNEFHPPSMASLKFDDTFRPCTSRLIQRARRLVNNSMIASKLCPRWDTWEIVLRYIDKSV